MDAITIDTHELRFVDDSSGVKTLESWSPTSPAGDGWCLHHKGWSNTGNAVAVWIRFAGTTETKH